MHRLAITMPVRISLYVLAALAIAAHFLRAGNMLLAMLCLATPGLFLLRQAWRLLLLEGLAYAAAACWLWTAWELVEQRRAAARPWLAALAILLTVAALSALAGALLRPGRQLRNQQRSRQQAGSQDGSGENADNEHP